MFEYFFGLDGRLGRAQFWKRNFQLMILLFLGVVVLVPLTRLMGRNPFLLALLALFPLIAIAGTGSLIVRRLHDHGRPTWLALPYLVVSLAGLVPSPPGRTQAQLMAMGLITLASVILFVHLYCLRGTRGPNRYGPDPRG
ncbi:DUF805 domain-containing protein [Prosthecodimorpha staleyi]|uniref:DUF805 domain-containing protein n=1 Tax=Prosthecodimorpha staleyi TaxID=2840188 RepID=A0A947GED8_9HYPH|nr:DUF805 domain-containing protein [Prosthecodimorpha staleyi]MBT9291306.1 DUF805 domain-containing protein [Prosthecodimorpha staleyi]